jgi:small subunit ribosomal protein S1
MSWTKKNVDPGKIVSTSQEVEVLILDVDQDKRRISLGIKQCQENPWEKFIREHPVGSKVTGEVRNITEFGLFIGLDADIDGLAHMSDLDWNEPGETAIARYKKGDTVSAKVLDVDIDKERISLGIKQLLADPMDAGYNRGDVVTCTVAEVTSGGVEVSFGPEGEFRSFIRKGDLSRDRMDQRPERFAVGDKVDALVTGVDRASRRVTVSIKALEMRDEKEAVEQYGSTDSGASLGDILGAALREQEKRN